MGRIANSNPHLRSAQRAAARHGSLGTVGFRTGKQDMFLVDTFAGLTSPIASKQCQLIIDFATKLLACHAGAVITLGVGAAKPRQAKVPRTERWLRSGPQRRPVMLQSRRVPGT